MASVCYDIAKWTLRIDDEKKKGMEFSCLLPQYEKFRIPLSDNCFAVVKIVADASFRFGREIGQFDCGGANHGVWRSEEGGYVFLISTPENVKCCLFRVTSDFEKAEAVLYGNTAEQAFGLNNALMIIFTFSMAQSRTLLLHASVVVKNERAYCFLGNSGTGKSTHSRLWQEALENVELLNDDNPVLRVEDDGVWIYGSPWSGKTPCYRNCKYRLGAVVRLSQAASNRIVADNKVVAFASLLSSCSTMIWDRKTYDAICHTVSTAVSFSPAYHLDCLPDRDAAILCSQTILA